MNAYTLLALFSAWPALCAALGAWAGYRCAPHDPLPVACRRSGWAATFSLLALAAGLLVWAYTLGAERQASFATVRMAMVLVALLVAALSPLAGTAAYRGVAFGHTLTHEVGGILGGALGAGLVLPLGLAVVLFLRLGRAALRAIG
ncbi:MAG: hypothetical protein AB7S38_17715 [Vulcanimicrobiota bacterium]